MEMVHSTFRVITCSILLVAAFIPPATAQTRKSPGPRSSGAVRQIVSPDFSTYREADGALGSWTSTHPMAEAPSSGESFPWPRSFPELGSAVRGVEWIEQNRGAVYNQPGELVRVRVKWSSPVPIKGMRLNDYVSPVPMFDDGTHGDAVPSDGIWTLDSLSVYSSTAKPYRIANGSQYQRAVVSWQRVEWELEDGTWENDGYAYVRIGIVDPLLTVDVEKVGDGLWATEYCLFVEDSLQSEKVFPGYPVTNKTFAYLLKPASTTLYSVMPDAYDFLVVTPATTVWWPNPELMERVPNASSIRNDVEGVGMTLFDNSSGWGSAARLKTVVYHSYGPFTMLAHELGHKWMAYLDSLTFSNGACGVHWAEHQTIGGNMGLWPKIVETSPGVFKGVMSHKPDAFNATYSDLDLYLMGLKPLNQVPLIKRLNNPDYTNPDTVQFTSITTTDPMTLPAKYGARNPAYPDAQRDFTMATVVVKPRGWTDAEFAYFSIVAKHASDTLDDGWGYNNCFEKAARKLATLESKMFTPTGAPSVPVTISPLDGATGQPLVLALHWSASQGAALYQVQVSRRDDFTDTLIVGTGLTATEFAPPGLRQGQTYYWRVRASSASGVGRYSDPFSFTTASPTAADPPDVPIVREFALHQGYPNPFNPSTTITFELPVRSAVVLSVFNSAGQHVATLVNGEREAGIHEVQFDGSGLASGAYYCRMSAGTFNDSKRILLVR